MEKTPLIENRENLQKVIMSTFHDEVKTLNSELQLMLIDDMITAFYNRLIVMKEIQKRDQRSS